MDIKKKILCGLAIASVALYKAYTFKIGPCSPELEERINQEKNDDKKIQ